MEQKDMLMTYFLLYNIVYLVIGSTMLGYGIYSIQDMGRVEYAVFSQNSFIAGAAIFIGAGALKIVLSLYGFIIILPFVPKKKPLMAVYTVATIFLMAWTFIAAIYAFQARVPAWDTLKGRLQTAYMAGPNRTTDVMSLENQLNCCGVTGQQDMMDGRMCNSTRSAEGVYGQGCLQQLGVLFTEQLYSIGAIGMAFGVFEGTAIIVAMQNMQG